MVLSIRKNIQAYYSPFHPVKPGRLVKFTTQLVAPQIVVVTTLVATNLNSQDALWQCLPQAQYSKIQAERIEGLCH